MSDDHPDILIRVGARQDATSAYPVEATLDDGSFFRGELRPDREALLEAEWEPEARAYGLALFNALFAGPIRKAYDKITGRAEAEAAGRLRVRLWIDDGAAELHALAWERLYHEHRGQAVPLACSIRTPFSRFSGLEIAEPEPIGERPIHLLIAIANPLSLPADLRPIEVEREVATLRQALGDPRQREQIRVTLMPGRTGLSSKLRAELEQEGYRIRDGVTSVDNVMRELAGCHALHFLGHGRFERRGERGEGTASLYLEREDGAWQAVTDDELVPKLAASDPLPHLVFLAACESARREVRAEHPWVGLGPKLVRAGVPAVVAMQDLVPTELARQLAGDFYRQLLEHGLIDRALNQARLLLWEHKQAIWSIPVLFTRLKQGRVFSAPTVRGPFMVEELPDDFVPRPDEHEQLIAHLAPIRRPDPPAGTTVALCGAGGYGKTGMARAVCHDQRVRRAFPDGVLWVTLGENPGDLTRRIEDLIYTLSGERPGFAGVDAATARFAELLADRDILLVIDDVWNAAHARPFLQGGPRCARLMTTRDSSTMPPNARTVTVAEMRPSEAVAVLGAGLPPGHPAALRALAARLGEWLLLLKLANGVLRARVHIGQQALPDALAYVDKALDKRGLVAFDARDAVERRQAVAKTLGASLELLREDERARYGELAIFPEDADIPLVTVEKLWGKTGGLDAFDTEELCGRLGQLSLLLRFDPAGRSIRLHDVLRSYLRTIRADALPALHGQLLDAYNPGRWADLPLEEPYLWDQLAEHLVGAGRGAELLATVKDLRYLAAKACAHGALAAEADLGAAEDLAPDDPVMPLLRCAFSQAGHLLNRCVTLPDLAVTLFSRLQHLEAVVPLTQSLERTLVRPYLAPWHPLPDLPHPALVRTVAVAEGSVMRCAVSADGSVIVAAVDDESGSAGDVLKVWDARDGIGRFTLAAGAELQSCAVSADGAVILSGSEDGGLTVWDGQTGVQRWARRGHADAVTDCTLSADGRTIVTASADRSLNVWDAGSGDERFRLMGHTEKVGGCAISADGTVIVSASDDHTLKVWDGQTGLERWTLMGHTNRVNSCAVSADGTVIVSASEDGTVKVWNGRTGAEHRTLDVGQDVGSCAISADGAAVVTASPYGPIIVWDGMSGQQRVVLRHSHATPTWSCAISADGALVVSDGGEVVNVWDVRSGTTRLTPEGQTAWGCAVGDDGALVVSASYFDGLKLWDAWSGRELRTLGKHRDPVVDCATSADGAVTVSAELGGLITIWETWRAKKRAVLREPPGSGGALTGGCAISADGTVVATTDRGELLIWEVQRSAERFRLSVPPGGLSRCELSADGSTIVAAAADRTLRVWDAHSGAERRSIGPLPGAISSFAVSADGSSMVSASEDKTLTVWDGSIGTERCTLSGHIDRVMACAFSGDGALIASVSFEGALIVWDARGGTRLATLQVDGRLFDCAWFPDGQHLVAAGVSGVYFLRLVC